MENADCKCAACNQEPACPAKSIYRALAPILGGQGLYSSAQEECIRAEVLLNAKSNSFALEFRDALRHIAYLFAIPCDDPKFRQQVDEAQTHLSRIRNESAEYRAEAAVIRLRQQLKWGTWWWPVLGVDCAKTPGELHHCLSKAQERIAAGRDGKNTRDDSYASFVEARDICEDASKSIREAQPHAKRAQLLFMIAVAVFGAFVGATIKHYWPEKDNPAPAQPALTQPLAPSK